MHGSAEGKDSFQESKFPELPTRIPWWDPAWLCCPISWGHLQFCAQGQLRGRQSSLNVWVQKPAHWDGGHHGTALAHQAPARGGHRQARQAPPCWGGSTHLDIFLRFLSSALAFWAEVKLSASARLSTAMARKTLSRISEVILLRSLGLWMKRKILGPESHPAQRLAGLNPTALVGLSEGLLPELPHGVAWARGHGRASAGRPGCRGYP